MKVDIQGVVSTIKWLREFGDEGDKNISDITEISAREIEREAKNLAAVDTGKMRQGTRAEQIGKSRWSITAYEIYSRFVEFGTVRMAAQPFLHPAWRRGIKIYVNDLSQALRVLTKKYNNK